MTRLSDLVGHLQNKIALSGDSSLTPTYQAATFFMWHRATEQLQCLNKGILRKNALIARLRAEIAQLKIPVADAGPEQSAESKAE